MQDLAAQQLSIARAFGRLCDWPNTVRQYAKFRKMLHQLKRMGGQYRRNQMVNALNQQTKAYLHMNRVTRAIQCNAKALRYDHDDVEAGKLLSKVRLIHFMQRECCLCKAHSKDKMKVCGCCRNVRYCSKRCQKIHWNNVHSKEVQL